MLTRQEIPRCAVCGKTIETYGDVGYDGPKDRGSSECSPFVEWETVCRKCEEGILDAQKSV